MSFFENQKLTEVHYIILTENNSRPLGFYSKKSLGILTEIVYGNRNIFI